MSKVAIVTDSTAYLPERHLQEYGIRVLPLKVIWGNESLDDGVDITPAEFYARLAESETLPTTSQVTIGEFKQLFAKLHADGREILALLISSEISGTLASARQAKAELPDANIRLVDSRTTSSELALLVLAAARMAQVGAGLQECETAIRRDCENSGVVFAVDTLEFLHRGGRIGGGRRFLGTVLNIKPILTMADGKVDALDQARTRRKSLMRLTEIVAGRVAGRSNLRLCVSHADAPEEAQKLLDMAAARLDPVETLITELSPVIGTHVGPGTLALAYHYED